MVMGSRTKRDRGEPAARRGAGNVRSRRLRAHGRGSNPLGACSSAGIPRLGANEGAKTVRTCDATRDRERTALPLSYGPPKWTRRDSNPRHVLPRAFASTTERTRPRGAARSGDVSRRSASRSPCEAGGEPASDSCTPVGIRAETREEIEESERGRVAPERRRPGRRGSEIDGLDGRDPGFRRRARRARTPRRGRRPRRRTRRRSARRSLSGAWVGAVGLEVDADESRRGVA